MDWVFRGRCCVDLHGTAYQFRMYTVTSKVFIARMINILLVIFIDRFDFVYNNITLSQSFVKPISGPMGKLISVRQE